jgi:integrase
VLLGAGLRVSELVGLDVSSVLKDVEGGAALDVRGKGRRDRTVPVLAEIAQLIRRYLSATGRHLGGDGPLFRPHDPGDGVPARRDRLSVRAVGMLVERLAAARGSTPTYFFWKAAHAQPAEAGADEHRMDVAERARPFGGTQRATYWARAQVAMAL